MKTLKSTWPLLGSIVLLLALFRVFVPTFLNSSNLLDLTQQISVNAILAFGMTLVILSGGIDLSVGALLALTGTAATFSLLPSGLGLPTPLAIAAGVGLGTLFGFFNGTAVSRTSLPPFIVTLATMLLARGCALRFNEGRPMSIPLTYESFLALGNGRVAGVPVPVIIMLILFAACAVLLHRTRYGQHLYALGGNREAARFAGIPVARVETLAYVVCGALAGVAGAIQTAQLYSAEPASGQGFELNAIAAAAVGGASFSGGRGTLFGTLLGAIIIGILDKGLNQTGVHFSIQYMVKGAVLLAAVSADVWRQKKTL
ncbi:MAG TPA: ABC transporter permease [Candidatus Binatia bacterium]|nr:ABC transporter permease [Candidatus Binatia bacterium]